MLRALVVAGAMLALCGCQARVSDGSDDFPATTTPEPELASPVETTTTTRPVAQVIGRVTAADGTPLADATVVMGDVSAVTAPDGWFDLETPHPGVMTVTRPGWVGADVPWDGAGLVEVTLEPFKVRGLRVSADAAGDDDRFREILDIAQSTAINTLVFDTKQEGGRVLYDTSVEAAHEIGAVAPAYDPAERIAQAKGSGLYLITRVVAFEDWFRSRAYPAETLVAPWLDPASSEAAEYVLALAMEACELGFDEIQFDYVRFPSGSAVDTSGQLYLTQARRVSAIEGFLSEARARLHPHGCGVSADVFGIVLSAENDQGIGQRPEELSRQVDALSPMVYPSHYSDGWLGFPDPNDHPYDVTADAIETALPRLEPGTILRPWLQAFWWTPEQIRRSVQAAEDHDVGWILWNVVSNYSINSIPTDEDLSSR